MDMDVKLTPKTADLRRTGLVCSVNAGLNNVDYYAYGPWENYNDRHAGCMVGATAPLWKTWLYLT